MRRAIKIEGIDKTLELSGMTVLRVQKKFFHLEEMKDGTFRIIVTESLIPDMTKVSGLTIIRED